MKLELFFYEYEIDAYDEFYEELKTSQLEYILELAQMWAELNEE